MNNIKVHILGWIYRKIAAPIFFLWDSEPIHEFFLDLGEFMVKVPGAKFLTKIFFQVKNKSLETTVAKINFPNPIGLAAGFDHEAQLPGIIGELGFGFESVGTVTNGAYGGNPYPRLKRLVKSKAILVNKGFKSSGMKNVIEKIIKRNEKWSAPVGISIGRTNTTEHNTHEDAIVDVLQAFKTAIDSSLPFSYFELNISCPNLLKDISFYDPEPFAKILQAIKSLNFKKPLFIKMPIGLNDDKIKALLDVCLQFNIAAVIFGNLQHDRNNPAFDQQEVSEYKDKRGNWSGMPCQARSDDLVKLAYTYTNGKLPIIGCGGIFNAEDAYRKIKNGASLIQMVAATIFEGPQVAGEICADLPKLLAKDGYKNISEAVGANCR